LKEHAVEVYLQLECSLEITLELIFRVERIMNFGVDCLVEMSLIVTSLKRYI